MAHRFFRPRRRTASRKKTADTPFFTPSPKSIQTKPEVGPSDDHFEKEADAIGKKAAESEVDAPKFVASTFNYNLEKVKIHTGAKSEQMNRTLKAQAFTQGNDIYFNKGKYQPGSKAGKKLLAHELTHVVQQGRGAGPAIQREPDTQAAATPEAETPLGAKEFQQIMKDRYGVTKVRVGSMEDQLTKLGLPTTKPIPGWEPWYLGSSSIFYNYIVNAFGDFQTTFGASPNIKTITFFPINYTRTQSPPIIVSKRQEVPAMYNNEELTIYKKIWYSDLVLPFARSDASGEYGPGTPIAVAEYGGDPNAAPIEGFPDKGDAVNRVILHELGHGLSRDVRTVSEGKPALDAAMIEDYKSKIGWKDETTAEGTKATLYDLMAAEVQKAVAENTALPAAFIITGDNWNDSKWKDQPTSKYAVTDGPGEDFAESIRTYIEKPELLQSRSPLRYNFIHSRKDQWQSALRPPTPAPTPESSTP